MSSKKKITINSQYKVTRLCNRTSKNVYDIYLLCLKKLDFNNVIFQRAIVHKGGIQSLMFSNLFIDKKVVKGIFASDFFKSNTLGNVAAIRGRIENLRIYHPRRKSK